MKISNGKKELARIISENGGWRDGAKFAAQDGDGTGSVDFFKSKPQYDKYDKYWKGEYDYQNRIKYADVTIKNFHQTILSREEYFHLYPATDADVWIEWDGKPKSPVDKGALVDVKMKDGTHHEAQLLDDECWSDNWGDASIIAYRLHKPEQAKSTAVGDDESNLAAKEELESMEFCEYVARSTPEPEAKPTIEQLAADYRNRKDYADRKQEEADAAKADAEDKLAELVAAGNALNLVISVSDVEPDLVITYWRDLLVGDIVKIVGSDNHHWKRLNGLELSVTRVGNSESDLVFAPSDGGEDWSHGGNTQWRFIRRQ